MAAPELGAPMMIVGTTAMTIGGVYSTLLKGADYYYHNGSYTDFENEAIQLGVDVVTLGIGKYLKARRPIRVNETSPAGNRLMDRGAVDVIKSAPSSIVGQHQSLTQHE